MLVGKYQNSIDAKGRMIVPAKFRDELGQKCIVSKAIDKCLEIHPMSEWERFMEKLSKLPSADPKARQLARHFYASAVEGEIDKQGRLTIPQELRDYANIGKDLITVGSYEKIEVWSKEEWDSSETTGEMDPSQLAESMMNYDF
ncbi:division/cell wall cluster transcriptional repressor MraZ [Anaerovorax odorimutans]|uniref:Transcriptional regulator MraZ n=1 Tax=Anaerovorax odorimutans TaxID=109327 RepID=A0ABT1RPT1_9FIRM|nr:division/cell wall cluster transcriptional repressor MraZ [Anaerovorax odorimutans]MCQ4637202.1 division/cell wall cluster transcriptional repressor MraZ [Anaerovorax odorimutans]